MATKLQIIYDVREHLKKYSDDSDYDDRHILYLYDLKRAKFLRQLLQDQTRNIDSLLIQSLCIEFEEVNKGLCGIEVPCDTVMRSKQPLPELLQIKGRNMLLGVSPSVAISKSFKVVSINEASYILNKPFSNGIYATMDTDNYIYLVSNSDSHKLIECLTIKGVFENPSDLENYTNCCGCTPTPEENCFTDDTTYPAQSFLVDLIRDEILKLFTLKEQLPEDKENDSTDG